MGSQFTPSRCTCGIKKMRKAANAPEYPMVQPSAPQMAAPPMALPAITQPQSLPWTVGCTDGSFATMALMQQQHGYPSSNQGTPPNGSSPIGVSSIASPDESANNMAALAVVQAGKSLYHDRFFREMSPSVESILTAACDAMAFDIVEMWLRTGPKTHQLANSHLRPTSLDDSVRSDLVDVYFGDKSTERTHRLSPSLCRRAKDANDVVWITDGSPHGAEELGQSMSNVRTAVAIPVCHEASNTNVTILFFAMRRNIMRPTAVEFLVHMSLSAAVASVNSKPDERTAAQSEGGTGTGSTSHSEQEITPPSTEIQHQRVEHTSITGARLDMQWRLLHNVEYLTDGGNSWIHTAILNGNPVVVKTIKPESHDVALAINEFEGELAIHSRLNHPGVVSLVGGGLTSKGIRFMVLERLDGGTLTQLLGYSTRIRDRRRRFLKKRKIPYVEVLRMALSIAGAMEYCHDEAIPGSMVLHRDLKPDNIAFTSDGAAKLIDFGLARIMENTDSSSTEVHAMSGETGSLRYMAPEVADALPYNHKADVYSFGMILWEINAGKKPFVGLSRDRFYERVVHGGERPPLTKKWPSDFCKLISSCWDTESEKRPTFGDIVKQLDEFLAKEEKGGSQKGSARKASGAVQHRHSTWF